ncbi:MAG: SRPBCC family protein [Ornithinimicrobium sp.]
MQELTHSDSVLVRASPAAVYNVVSDVTRTGEWSPTCVRCEWDDPDQVGPGATFTGYNETATRSWQTTSTVIAADGVSRFTWEVGKGFVRWSYDLEAIGEDTQLRETWTFLPAGLQFFSRQYGERADDEIQDRAQRARDDIPRTLASVKAIAEARDEASPQPRGASVT